MKKTIGDFVEDYVEGEPLTTDTMAWAIRKYMIRTMDPTDKEKIEAYEAFLHRLSEAYINEDEAKYSRLLRNASLWYIADKHVIDDTSEDPEGDRNEAFHNINITY